RVRTTGVIVSESNTPSTTNQMRTDVTLRGSKADQFERIQNYLEDRRGHDLSRADVVGIMMAEFEQGLDNNRR
ncbi:hypothetical protein, partial [Natrinema versiforme]